MRQDFAVPKVTAGGLTVEIVITDHPVDITGIHNLRRQQSGFYVALISCSNPGSWAV